MLNLFISEPNALMTNWQEVVARIGRLEALVLLAKVAGKRLEWTHEVNHSPSHPFQSGNE